MPIFWRDTRNALRENFANDEREKKRERHALRASIRKICASNKKKKSAMFIERNEKIKKENKTFHVDKEKMRTLRQVVVFSQTVTHSKRNPEEFSLVMISWLQRGPYGGGSKNKRPTPIKKKKKMSAQPTSPSQI